MQGSQINTRKIPPAFWTWYNDLKKRYALTTIEVQGHVIVVCRAKRVVSDDKEIEGLGYGKLVEDSGKSTLVRTFRPVYYSDEDVVRSG